MAWPPCSARQFRLLFVRPALDDSNELHVTLKVYEHGSSVQYQTLSYVWGNVSERSKTAHVLSPHGRIAITPRLHDILLSIRSDYAFNKMNPTKIGLWVDAICIDQADPDDRLIQVASIGLIYSRSIRLIIWLGHHLYQWQEEELYDHVQKSFKRKNPSAQDSENGSDSIATAVRMVAHPYHTRLWVVQEILQTSEDKRWIFFGNHSIPLEDFENTPTSRAFTSFSWRQLDAPFEQHLPHVDDLPSYHHSTPRRSLLENLHRWSHRECHDPRDRIYSILSVSEDDVLKRPAPTRRSVGYGSTAYGPDAVDPVMLDMPIKPDYRIDVTELYMHVARLYAQSASQAIPLLAYATVHRMSSSQGHHYAEWPSWVPDWSTRGQYISDDHCETVSHMHVCGAAWTCYATGAGIGIDGVPVKDDRHKDALNRWGCNVLEKPCIVTASSMLRLHGWIVQRCQGPSAQQDSGVEQCKCPWHKFMDHRLGVIASVGLHEVAASLLHADYVVLLFGDFSIGVVAIKMEQPRTFRLHSCFQMRWSHVQGAYDFSDIVGGGEAQEIFIS